MKMKYIVAGYTVVVVLLLCFIHVEMTRENQFDVDMVYYNRQLKQVEAELEAASDNIRDIEDNSVHSRWDVANANYYNTRRFAK